jgi:hypothetical protein
VSYGFGNKIHSIFDELGIQAKGMAKRSFDLRGRIIILLEPANGKLYQGVKGWDIRGCSLAKQKLWNGGHFWLFYYLHAKISMNIV